MGRCAAGRTRREVVLVGPDVRDQEFVLSPVQTSGRSLRVPLGTGEYLQLEYRPQSGFDIGLPASGVLIYHIDLTRPLYPSVNGPRIYRVKLVEADGDSALVRTAIEGGNRGVAADAWAVNTTGRFTPVTSPQLRRNSGVLSTVTIHSIAIAGGVVGLLVAQWGGAVIRALFLPPDMSVAVVTDVRTLACTAILTLAAAMLTGVAPALGARRHDVSSALKAGEREGGERRSTLRRGLLVFQAALSVVLLVGAGLLVRSFIALNRVNPGFDTRDVLAARIRLTPSRYQQGPQQQ